MLLKQILNESQNIDEWINYIRINCKKFIYDSNGLPLYRGVRCKNDKIFSIEKIRNDRSVASISLNASKGLEQAMIDSGFKQTRSNSILATGNKKIAKEFGEIYRIFISSDYDYLWNPHVDDYISLVYDWKVEYDRLMKDYDDGYDFWIDVKEEYIQSKRLIDAIASGVEILIKADYYYTINVNIANDKYHKIISDIEN